MVLILFKPLNFANIFCRTNMKNLFPKMNCQPCTRYHHTILHREYSCHTRNHFNSHHHDLHAKTKPQVRNRHLRDITILPTAHISNNPPRALLDRRSEKDLTATTSQKLNLLLEANHFQMNSRSENFYNAATRQKLNLSLEVSFSNVYLKSNFSKPL